MPLAQLFRRIAAVIVFTGVTCVAQSPNVEAFISDHRFVDGRIALLLYWAQNHKFATTAIARLEKQASLESQSLLAKAEAEYDTAVRDRRTGGHEAEEAAGHNLESIGLLRRGIDEFGPEPVFLYDISLNYYAIKDIKHARYFLELSDAFLPTDKNFHTYETLRSLVLSGAIHRDKVRNLGLFRTFNELISKPYLYSPTEDAAHYESVCKFLLTNVLEQVDLEHIALTDRNLELPDGTRPPPEVLFNLIKCAERKGYIQTADVLVRQYDLSAPDSYLDYEYRADRDFIGHLSDAVKRSRVDQTPQGEIVQEVKDKVSAIMQAREVRDYVTVDKEYRDTSNLHSSDLVEEMRWGRARWLRLCGKIDEARAASTNLLSSVDESDPRFPELKLEVDGLPTARAQYDRLLRVASSQIAQISQAQGSTPRIMHSTLGMSAGTLAQARRLFPYALEANSSLAWVHLQVGDHRGLVEDLDVAALHHHFVTLPVCVRWGPRQGFKKMATSACGMFQVRPQDDSHPAMFGWSKLVGDAEHVLEGSLFSTVEPEQTRSLDLIEKITRTREGDVRIDLHTGERIEFTVHTVFDLVYTARGYFTTLTGGSDLPFLRPTGEKRSMPLEIRRARGNDLIIALVRYGAPFAGSGVLAPQLLHKVSREGLSILDWMIIVNYTWVTAYGAVGNFQNGGPLFVRFVNFLDQEANAYAALSSWHYAMISRRAGDPRVRTRFRVVPLESPSFLTKW